MMITGLLLFFLVTGTIADNCTGTDYRSIISCDIIHSISIDRNGFYNAVIDILKLDATKKFDTTMIGKPDGGEVVHLIGAGFSYCPRYFLRGTILLAPSVGMSYSRKSLRSITSGSSMLSAYISRFKHSQLATTLTPEIGLLIPATRSKDLHYKFSFLPTVGICQHHFYGDLDDEMFSQFVTMPSLTIGMMRPHLLSGIELTFGGKYEKILYGTAVAKKTFAYYYKKSVSYDDNIFSFFWAFRFLFMIESKGYTL